MRSQFAILLITVLLGGCVSLPSEREAPPAAPASDKAPVVALLDRAKRDTDAGKLDSAAASLERALRIEPRNPTIWHQLAQLRLHQGQPEQAAQLAAKSNAFAGSNKRLAADNWHIIGQARSLRGDSSGAEAAFAKAREIERSL